MPDQTRVLILTVDTKSYRAKNQVILLYVSTRAPPAHNIVIKNKGAQKMKINKNFSNILRKDRKIRFLFGSMVIDGLMVISLLVLAGVMVVL